MFCAAASLFNAQNTPTGCAGQSCGLTECSTDAFRRQDKEKTLENKSGLINHFRHW
jgi:hypothetical protein